MYSIKEITEKIEKFAPLDTACDWDNSGWQIKSKEEFVENIMTCTTCTADVVKQAIDKNCKLILSHHPVFFKSIKSLLEENNEAVMLAVKNGIQIYSAHTNLDIAKNGITDTLAKNLGFENIDVIAPFIKGKKLNNPINIENLINNIKAEMGIKNFRMVNPKNIKEISSICFCGGSADITEIDNGICDLIVTGEVKYHEAVELKNIAVIELGHYISEKFTNQIFSEILGIKLYEAIENEPFEFV